MIDIKLVRENPELVKENMKKKFQDNKLGLVDEVLTLDKELRAAKLEADTLRGKRNSISKSIGMLMAQKKVEEANEAKQEVVKINVKIVKNLAIFKYFYMELKQKRLEKIITTASLTTTSV